MRVQVRPGAQRFETDAGWVRSRHAFSYGAHYDPANTHFGALLACNDDILEGGAGFEEHAHRGVDIVTWMIEGALTHADSSGSESTLGPATAQRLWTADGVRHSERNLTTRPARYVQMWIEPDAGASGPPAYGSRDFGDALDGGKLVAVAAGPGAVVPGTVVPGTVVSGTVVPGTVVAPQIAAPLPLARTGAALLVARPAARATLAIPPSPLMFVYVARGRLVLDDESLAEGDAAAVTGAASPLALRAQSASEILCWQMPPDG